LEGQRDLHLQLQVGDKITDTFEEGSDLKEYKYMITGGTGKYEGASVAGARTPMRN
jgi:hypothetical protein